MNTTSETVVSEPIVVDGRECAFCESIDFKDQWFILDALADLILSPDGKWIECDKARYGFGHPYAGYYRQEFKFASKEEARAFAQQFASTLARQPEQGEGDLWNQELAGGLTVDEWCDFWLSEMRPWERDEFNVGDALPDLQAAAALIRKLKPSLPAPPAKMEVG